MFIIYLLTTHWKNVIFLFWPFSVIFFCHIYVVLSMSNNQMRNQYTSVISVNNVAALHICFGYIYTFMTFTLIFFLYKMHLWGLNTHTSRINVHSIKAMTTYLTEIYPFVCYFVALVNQNIFSSWENDPKIKKNWLRNNFITIVFMGSFLHAEKSCLQSGIQVYVDRLKGGRKWGQLSLWH